MDKNCELVKSAESLLETLENEPLGLEQLKAEIDKEGVNDKTKEFHKRKVEYTESKYKSLDSETRLLYFKHLENGTELPLEETGKELKKAAKCVRTMKSELQDLRAEREELCYKINPAYEEYLQLKDELKALTDEVRTLQSEVNMEGQHKEEEEAMNEMIAEVQAAIEEEKEKIEKNQQLEWCNNYIELMERLSNVKLKFRSSDKLVLEFHDDSRSGDGETLEATVTVDGSTVEDIKVSLLSLDADDICQSTVQQNQLRAVVSRLHSRWQHHLPLLTELNELRHRFVLDWLAEESRVTVLYGKDAHMMCIVHVEEGYPATGGVRLLSTSGLHDHISPDTLKPESAKASLTEWLEHMQARLSPSTEEDL